MNNLKSLFADYLDNKLGLIKKLKPRDINDLFPLVRVSPLILARLETTIKREKLIIAEGNRIYNFASRLNVEPSLVSKYFSTHMFMFDLDWDMVETNLTLMLKYEVRAISILRDLHAFKYYPSGITARFDRCRQADKKDIKLWMIRCPEEVLERTFLINKESKELLGKKTKFEYLANRLDVDTDTIKNILSKHPSVQNVKPMRVSVSSNSRAN